MINMDKKDRTFLSSFSRNIFFQEGRYQSVKLVYDQHRIIRIEHRLIKIEHYLFYGELGRLVELLQICICLTNIRIEHHIGSFKRSNFP